jgi:NAD(P)H-hydrate repair Nnr-like enzyme with NAD(P)H-hydrate epimerase domain
MRRAAAEHYGITTTQVAEAAGYSMAMVVRYALGLSAREGRVCVIAADGLAGLVALATLRHLVIGGAGGAVLLSARDGERSAELEAQIKSLTAMHVPVEDLEPIASSGDFGRLIADCHNVLWGASDPSANSLPHLSRVIETLNEGRTPVHAVDLPGGINPDTGASLGAALVASSTLSLGWPLEGLAPGKDRVGRHYVCDASISRDIVEAAQVPWTPLFAEQPVVQIFAAD